MRVDNRKGDRHRQTPERKARHYGYEASHRERRRAAGLCPYCRDPDKPIDGIMCEACKRVQRDRGANKTRGRVILP